MQENSKKPKLSKSEQRQLKKQLKLEKRLAELGPSGALPAGVAQSPKLPDTLYFLDGTNYQLIFENYNHKECELRKLNTPALAKAMVDKLSALTKFNSTTIKQTNLIRDKVENDGKYASLYRGLDGEIELIEVKFGDTGRIFCYMVDNYPHGQDRSSNYCCIVAIKTLHVKT